MKVSRMSRNYRTANGWRTAAITEEEQEHLDGEMRRAQIELMKGCVSDANEALGLSNVEQTIKAAVAMFVKRCPDVFTVYHSFLDEKVRVLRDEENSRAEGNAGQAPDMEVAASKDA